VFAPLDDSLSKSSGDPIGPKDGENLFKTLPLSQCHHEIIVQHQSAVNKNDYMSFKSPIDQPIATPDAPDSGLSEDEINLPYQPCAHERISHEPAQI
jgi:hypothetical protein